MPARGNSQVARPSSRLPRLISAAVSPPQHFSRQLPASVRLSRSITQDKSPLELPDALMALPQDKKASVTLEKESIFSEPLPKRNVPTRKARSLATPATSKQYASVYGNDDAEMMQEKHTAAVDDGTNKKKTSPEPSIDDFWDAEFASTLDALDSWGRPSERFQTNIANWEKEVDDEINEIKKLTSNLEPRWKRKERNMKLVKQHYEEALHEARKSGAPDQDESGTEEEFLLSTLENEIKKRQLDTFSGGNQEFGDETQEEMNQTEQPDVTSIPESRSRIAGTGIPDSRSPSLTEAGTFGNPTSQENVTGQE